MTLEEKISRYRSIPKRITELQIDKEICTSVKAVQYDGIGDGKGTPENHMEMKMVDAAAISAEIEGLQQEQDALALDIMLTINRVIQGDDVHKVDTRTILKSCLLEGKSLKYIANRVVHRAYSVTRDLYRDGFAELKKQR